MQFLSRRAAVGGVIAAITASAGVARARQAEPTFSPDRFRSHVEFLASDLVEGRSPGTRGYDLAALYVAEQFRGLGLKPAGENGTWYQQVRLQERRFGEGTPALTITGADGKPVRFANADNVLLSPSAEEPATRFDAGVVFVGFGMDDPANGYNDYRGLDVRGKIVVALSGSPKGTPTEIGAHLNNVKSKNAARRGAIGFITLDTDVTEKAFAWAKRTVNATQPRYTWIKADGTPFLSAPGVRGGASLNRPAAEALFAGQRRTLADIRAEADKPGGKPKGFVLKGRVGFDFTSTQRTITSPNVAALLPGSDPALKDEVVLIMGHLDHFGVRPDRIGDQIYNGALDNASGISAVIETARAFVDSGQRPKRSVLFLAVTAEERGLLGSEYFAEYPTVPMANLAGVVNIDMPILTYDFGDIIAYGADSSTLGESVRRAAARIGVTLTPDPQPEQGLFTRSDHYSLVKKGVPSIFLKTGPADNHGEPTGAANDRDFRLNRYHEPTDDLAQSIDWVVGAKFARVNWLIASEIANATDRPRWYEGDFFGNTFAKGAPRAPKPAAAPR